MPMLSQQQIIQYLTDANPWWVTGTPPNEYGLYKRTVFYNLVRELKLKQITSIVGLRRTGKTTVLKQLIGHLLEKERVNPKLILFFNFEQNFIDLKPQLLEQVLYAYLQLVLQTSLPELRDKIYVFFDEIQYLPLFQGALKRFYDLQPLIKFSISGSASLFIRASGKESLAGRIFETHIKPLEFREFLDMQSKSVEKLPLLDITRLTPREIEKRKLALVPRLALLEQDFTTYILKGQFPETLAFFDNEPKIREYLRDSILKKIIESDLPQFVPVDNPGEFATIFRVLASETGNILSYQTLASETSISQITVKKYIHYLEQTFLVSILYNYSKSERTKKKFLKKHYIASTNFAHTILGLDANTLRETGAFGHLVETQVFNTINTKEHIVEFWNKRGMEVDFIIDKRLCVEVKYKRAITAKDYKALTLVMERLRAPYGVLITQTDFDVRTINGKHIFLLPACLL